MDEYQSYLRVALKGRLKTTKGLCEVVYAIMAKVYVSVAYDSMDEGYQTVYCHGTRIKCPECQQIGVINSICYPVEQNLQLPISFQSAIVVDGCEVICHCPSGTHLVSTLDITQPRVLVCHYPFDFISSGDIALEILDEAGLHHKDEQNNVEDPLSEEDHVVVTATGIHLKERQLFTQKKVDEILNIPKGQRPSPSTYMTPEQINAHLAQFDDGAVRFASQHCFELYGTYGPDGGFVMPSSQFEQILVESQGDLRRVEQKLGLEENYLNSDDTIVIYIEKENFKGLNVPSGNEVGANQYWVPGGITSGGVIEAVMDLSQISHVGIIDLQAALSQVQEDNMLQQQNDQHLRKRARRGKPRKGRHRRYTQ